MRKSNPTTKAQILQSAFYVLLILSVCAIPFALAQRSFDGRRMTSATLSRQIQRTLTFADRVAYQCAIEDAYWRHRIWPKENLRPKPSLDEVMSAAQIEKKVEDYLRDSQALEVHWQKPIAREQLQAEMERMTRNTKQPEVLRELFEALGNDPFVIAECLARPVLAERLIRDLTNSNNLATAGDLPLFSAHDSARPAVAPYQDTTMLGTATYVVPKISNPDGCIDDTWTATSTTNAPVARLGHTAVWTGSEMIVWGGLASGSIYVNTGGRYDPSTDSWIATSTTNAPSARESHTAVWTGSEMIVWGGEGTGVIGLNTGGRYNPSTDSWTATSTTNAPTGREAHTTVWTGSEMIAWGGVAAPPHTNFNTGGRYNPSTDSWTATSTTNAPSPRDSHTAVWTGTEVIVWGGAGTGNFNTGGRYVVDTDSWTATSTTNAPTARSYHTAVLAGSEMIVWGGSSNGSDVNTGGRYNPSTDNWTATSTTNGPTARERHTAVSTGNEMIVWGGLDGNNNRLNTGGRYNPSTDSWTATSTTNAPSGRFAHTAVWTATQMIVCGGRDSANLYLNTGGRYCASGAGPTPTPTATPTATSTPTATPTATATATPRPTPTPRLRPTAAPRP